MKRLLFLCFLGFLSLVAAFADFGLVLSEGLLLEGDDETAFNSKTTLSPWLSLPLGGADFYLSMGISADYQDSLVFIPELHRLELSFTGQSPFGFRLGRIPWQDPTLFTARGFFDGLDLYVDLGRTRIGAAALYTGFLYKDTSSINNSPGDPVDYSLDFDWLDFENTYFAPRRFLSSLYGEFPGLPFGRGNIYAALLAQFDLGDAEFHTQYLLFRYLFNYRRFNLAAGGAVELENTLEQGYRTAYAFSLEAGINGSAFIRDRFSLGLRWASGESVNTAAFFPLIREAQGLAFKPVFSGMAIIRAQYQALLLPTLGAQLGGRYFIRTDTTSFMDSYLENDSSLLGAEVDGGLSWNPFSDLSFTFSGGLFFPQTGNAFASAAPLRWALSLRTIFSF